MKYLLLIIVLLAEPYLAASHRSRSKSSKSYKSRSKHSKSNLFECYTGESEKNVDLFPHKVKAEQSQNWSITYHGTYKILTNIPAQKTYLLYQCGTEPPSDAAVMYDAVIPVPLQDGMALTETTQIPHIELLGKRTDVNAYVGDPSYISSPCMDELIDEGRVEIIPDDDVTALENWLVTHPDGIILAQALSSADQDNLVVISESLEKTNMAIFEWHKVYASFFNMEKMANHVFESTSDKYDCISSRALEQVEVSGSRPSLVWAYWSASAEAWDVAECENYYCEYARQCGTDFLSSSGGSVETGGQNYMTIDEFVAFARDADYWVYASDDWDDVYTTNYLNRAKLRGMKSVMSRQVFDTQGHGRDSWFEQRMAEPDVVLSDFCSMVGTGTFDEDYQRVWLRNVFTQPIGIAGICTDVDAPLVTNSATC
eukprot:CAMPEP_0172490280 /NCGR_PEP_ID=MMETSP1066-20121228/20647_1 /TAXON_ID=671091 /ORGANISM="Coscinodiscus wailesii, Strain CCMP2513" /LENGTH=426 /DNA_ID=CAMNT_0013258667 /DNA_START=122 /DNA_END=1402 /DNA_ORIENTATION=+